MTAKLSTDSTRSQALAQAHVYALNINAFKELNHPLAQAYKLTTLWPNIPALTYTLRYATDVLVKREKFDGSRIPIERLSLSVEDLFLDERKRYIKPDAALVSFRDAALAFMLEYYAIEKADYGIPNYNQRVLMSLVHESVSIAQTLRKFKHEERKQQ